jgi:hypothetical protein
MRAWPSSSSPPSPTTRFTIATFTALRPDSARLSTPYSSDHATRRPPSRRRTLTPSPLPPPLRHGPALNAHSMHVCTHGPLPNHTPTLTQIAYRAHAVVIGRAHWRRRQPPCRASPSTITFTIAVLRRTPTAPILLRSPIDTALRLDAARCVWVRDVSSACVRCVCAVCAPCVRRVCAVCAPCARCVCAVCAPACTVCAVCPSTPCSSSMLCACAVGPVRRVCVLCAPRCVCAVCAPCVRRVRCAMCAPPLSLSLSSLPPGLSVSLSRSPSLPPSLSLLSPLSLLSLSPSLSLSLSLSPSPAVIR